MNTQKDRRLSLKRRCMGPRAVSIETLIQRAEAAAQTVLREFPAHALGQVEELARLGQAALADRAAAERWAAFRAKLRDLQTSSAMGGAHWVASYAAALQVELGMREPWDPNLPKLLDLHLDALRIAAGGTASDAELAALDEKLRRATLALRH